MARKAQHAHTPPAPAGGAEQQFALVVLSLSSLSERVEFMGADLQALKDAIAALAQNVVEVVNHLEEQAHQQADVDQLAQQVQDLRADLAPYVGGQGGDQGGGGGQGGGQPQQPQPQQQPPPQRVGPQSATPAQDAARARRAATVQPRPGQ